MNSRPVTIANTSHVGGSRPNLIHSGSLTAGHIPVNPPPLVRAQTHMYSRAPVNNAQRYALRQRPPYHPVPDTRPQTRHTIPFSHPSAPTSHPQASLNVRPNGQPPPKPTVSISGAANGIVLSWDMLVPQECAPIDSYQLYACQDHNQGNSSKVTWKKLGIVKALPLPMACTLTQFVSGCTYYFSVRAIDVHGRSGDYSTPRAITLPRENEKEQTWRCHEMLKFRSAFDQSWLDFVEDIIIPKLQRSGEDFHTAALNLNVQHFHLKMKNFMKVHWVWLHRVFS